MKKTRSKKSRDTVTVRILSSTNVPFTLSTVPVQNLALVETLRKKMHRSLTPNSDWLAGCNKSSELVLQSYFLNNLSVDSVSDEFIFLTQSAMKSFPRWLSQRWNSFRIDSDSDEFRSALADRIVRCPWKNCEYLNKPEQWAYAKIYSATSDEIVSLFSIKVFLRWLSQYLKNLYVTRKRLT
jgi:hypothetical protein